MKNTPKIGQLVHIVAAKTEEIERLEKTIDQVTTDKWDLQDRVKRVETELESARAQLKGIHELQQRQQSGHNDELFRAQRNLTAAEKEQERIQQNYNHAQQTIQQMNATVDRGFLFWDEFWDESWDESSPQSGRTLCPQAGGTLQRQRPAPRRNRYPQGTRSIGS